MNQRVRYIVAAACALLAGLLTLLYLGGRSAAGGSESAIIWVTSQPVTPGSKLDERMLQRVRVDGPTLRLLAREALPAEGELGQWYASGSIEAGEPLIPGWNLSTQPTPALPGVKSSADLRIITLSVDPLPPGANLAGEEVDIYVVPERGGESVRVLAQARVVLVEGDLLSLLVPEQQVAPVLTATEGGHVKVVRRLRGMGP